MSDPLAAFADPVREWFTSTFREATAPQRKGWPAIANGDHTLILAPTGTGKTLSAFLWALNRLAVDGEPVRETPLAARLEAAGFSPGYRGMTYRG